MRRGENFPLLDTLRGIAALAVMLFHARDIFFSARDHTSSYLAVDFFFMLSGFVVCAAYGRRLENGLGLTRFMTIRLIRLWPMLFIGALLGDVVWTTHRLLDHTATPTEGLLITMGAVLLIPAGLLYGAQAFPADGPIWSLFFELVANALYAIKLPAQKLVCGVVVGLCAVALIVASVHQHSLESFGHKDPPSFLLGLPRVIVPFALGVLLYRYKVHQHFAGFPVLLPPLALGATLYFQSSPPWIFDLAASFILFPIIVATAAGSQPGALGKRVAWISGELSYPAYLIHIPVMRAMVGVQQKLHLSPTVAETASVVIALVASWVLLQYVDKPVRRALDQWLLGDRNQRELILQPAL